MSDYEKQQQRLGMLFDAVCFLGVTLTLILIVLRITIYFL
jgi:cytochrome c-type biogenesis protein CcmE